MPPPKPAWTPGGATPAPRERAVWPRIAGVLVAIAAQGMIYLALKRMSSVAMPAWAHHHVPVGQLPWPGMVPVAVVHGAASPMPGDGTLPAPVLMTAPSIVMPAPVIVLAPAPAGPDR